MEIDFTPNTAVFLLLLVVLLLMAGIAMQQDGYNDYINEMTDYIEEDCVCPHHLGIAGGIVTNSSTKALVLKVDKQFY